MATKEERERKRKVAEAIRKSLAESLEFAEKEKESLYKGIQGEALERIVLQAKEALNGFDTIIKNIQEQEEELQRNIKQAKESLKGLDDVIEHLRAQEEELSGKQNEFEKIIERYENAGRFKKAAKLAEKKIGLERVIQVYEKAGWFIAAGELAEEINKVKRAFQDYEKGGAFHNAARLAEKRWDVERAIDYYEKAGRLDLAVKLVEKKRKLERKIEKYEKAELFREAGELAEKIGDVERAIQLYEKAGERAAHYSNEGEAFHNAARLAEKIGGVERAIQVYEKAEWFQSAAKLAEKIGDVERAKILYERAIQKYEKEGAFHNAAKLAEKMGDVERAKILYESEIDYFEKAGERANYFEKAGLFVSAAKLAEKIGDVERAIQIYEKGSLFQEATELAEKIGDIERANKLKRLGIEKIIEYRERREQYEDAAKLAKEIGDLERAQKYYKKARISTRKEAIETIFIKGGMTLGLLTFFTLANSGIVEYLLSYIPFLVGHSETGKYWDGMHEYQELIAKINNTQPPERDTSGFFPEPEIIKKYWIADTNAIKYSAEKGTKPLLEDKATKEYRHLQDMEVFATAVVEREDKAFYVHHGINWMGVGRALVYLGRRGGGSSITMQVTKQLMQERTKERETIGEKIVTQLEEAIFATELERKYTKDEILEFYLNNIYFGPGIYGAELATEFYFGKDTKDVTPWESLFLASIINNPSNITHKQREEQRKWVEKRLTAYDSFLQQEVDEKTRKEYMRRVGRALFARIDAGEFDQEVTKRTEYSENFPSSMNLLFYELERRYAIPIKTMRQDQERVYGIEIQTTIDPILTREVNSILKKRLNNAEHYAFVLVDADGNIKALIGDKDYVDFTGFNYATHGLRPMASTIKPFVYAYGLEEKVFAPDTTFSDRRGEECQKPDAKCISNHDDIYGRSMSIPEALRNSNNVMTAKAYQQILKKSSFEDFADEMKNLGISINPENEGNQRVAIGIDVNSPLRLALAYASFLDGYAHDYTLIDKVLVGDELIQKQRQKDNEQLFSVATTQFMQSALEYVAAGKITHPTYTIGLKTGTYEDERGISRDLWLSGILMDKTKPQDGYAFAFWVDNQNSQFGTTINAASVLTPVVQDIVLCIK